MRSNALRRLLGSPAAHLGLIAAAAILLMLLVDWRYHAISRDNEALAHERLVERATALSALLADTVAATLGQVDVLHGIAGQVTTAMMAGRMYSAGELQRALDKESMEHWPDVAQVGGIGSDGWLIWSNLTAAPGRVDLGAREHFRALADNPDLDRFIGRPVLGKVSGEWTVQTTQALRDGERRLRAVTVVSVRASLLQRLCAQLNLDAEDRVLLVRDDAVVLMRSNMQHLGETLTTPPDTVRVPRGGSLVYERASPLDGALRVVSMRPVPGASASVHVALSLDSRRAALEQQNATLWHWAMIADAGIVITALLAGTVLLMLRRTAMESARAAAMAENQRWFRAVADYMADGAIVLDNLSQGSFRIAYASRRACEILGQPEQQLVGGELHRLFGAADQARSARERGMMAAGTALFASRYVIRRPDGRDVTLMLTSMSAPKPERPGELRGVTLLRDVTAEEQRAAALAEARGQIDTLLKVAPGVFYRAVRAAGEAAFRASFVSESARALLGMAADAPALPRQFDMMFAQGLAALRDAALAGAAADGIATVEYPCVIGGAKYWLRDTIRTIPREDGACEIVGFLADATRQHETEEALHAAVQFGPGVLYRAHVTKTAVTVLSAHGDASRVSDRYAPGQAIELASLSARMTELGDAGRFFAAEGDALVTVEHSVARNGHVRWIRNAARAARRGPDHVEIVGYIIDITREKTEQLRMQQVTTLLTLGEMATGMAHELNQPLASISFAAQNARFLLAADPPRLTLLDGKLDKIASEALRASRLIEHMRIFARNERAAPGPIRWADALLAAKDLLQARPHGCTIIDLLPDDLPPVEGAQIPMEQVLINLIGNAFDAYDTQDDAEHPVTVSGAFEGGMVLLRVADKAGGIPKDVMPRILEPFFTTKPVGKGTGLGLALVFGTVTEMGGIMDIRNENGGAVFEIRLPPARQWQTAAEPAMAKPKQLA